MHISVKNIREAECGCDVLILPFSEGDPHPYGKLGPAIGKLVSRVWKREFYGKDQEVLLMHAPGEIKPVRLLFLGIGKKENVTPERIRRAGGRALTYLRDLGIQSPALSTTFLSTLGQSPADFAEGGMLGLYRFDTYRSEKQDNKITGLTILSRPSAELNQRIRYVKTVASASAFARDLINTPANDMTPTDLARAALSLRGKGISVKVLGKKELEKLGMGAYLAVSSGSKEPPKFIVLEYRGTRKPPVVLIGKSITFDSGGISLKPSEGMEKMKYDMAGGAAVMGVLKAAAELKLPVHLVGLLPATENLPGGAAAKPGDVVRSFSGKTIEIVNTDAEGRLALADALGYAKRFKPRAVVDIATLTGACAIALGGEAVAMMGNDRDLLDAFKKAGDDTYERVCEMPLYEEYKDYLKSDIADIKNVGGRMGSLMASAYFLYEFAEQTPWVHLDIAGTAWVEKDRPYIPKGASGIGLRLILNLIERIA